MWASRGCTRSMVGLLVSCASGLMLCASCKHRFLTYEGYWRGKEAMSMGERFGPACNL